MKKLNVIYNHNIYEQPYKQSEVKKVDSEIKNKFGQDVQIFISHSSLKAPNPFFYDCDLIIAEHTFDMTKDDKKALADILKSGVTKVKTANPIDVVISFRKISDDDIWFFEA